MCTFIYGYKAATHWCELLAFISSVNAQNESYSSASISNPKTFFAAIAVLQRTKHECSFFLNANLVHFITLQALGIRVSSYSQIPSQKCH